MSWSRREVLASLGVASAQAILWACGGQAHTTRRKPAEVDPEVRTWLHDAVARLQGAGFASVHVLAMTRERMTTAIDVLGAGVARAQADGVVITVRDRAGTIREHVTNDLSRDGVLAAARVLAGAAKPASVDFGRAPPALHVPNPDPRLLSDGQLLARVGALAQRDHEVSSRIIYSAAVLDIDDATVWSVAPGRDLAQRLVRVRQSLTRVAWNGTQPVVSEASHAWTGGIDEQELSQAEIIAVEDHALELMTPRPFEEREYQVALEPEVAASVIDVAVRSLLTSTAARRPEVARRLAIGANVVAPIMTLVDDPSAPHAYGGFQFDDEGEPARAIKLVEHGQIVGRLEDRGGGRGRRPGHVGVLEPAPSHLRVAPGKLDEASLIESGFVLEGPLGTIVDPASDRVVIAVARARERVAGKRTGRVFANIELVGELGKLLASISELSQQTRSIGFRDDQGGQPRWRSIETPSLRARGLLRARRRPT